MKQYISWVLIAVCIVGLISCGKKAEPVVLPAVNEIDSINIMTYEGAEVSYSDKEWIEQFFAVITQAEATAKESVQDIPNTEFYGKVDISSNGEITTIFYYTEGGKNYIEQPYQGIYVSNVDIDALMNE